MDPETSRAARFLPLGALLLLALAAFVAAQALGVVPSRSSTASGSGAGRATPGWVSVVVRVRTPDGRPVPDVPVGVLTRGHDALAEVDPDGGEPLPTHAIAYTTGSTGDVRFYARPGARLTLDHGGMTLPSGLTTHPAFNAEWTGDSSESIEVPRDLMPGVAHIVEVGPVFCGALEVALRSSDAASEPSAQVRLWATGASSVRLQKTRTAVDEVRFERVPVGRFVVLAGRPSTGAAPVPREVEVVAGRTTRVELDLTAPSGFVRGRLVDEDGAPYAEVPIDIGYLVERADWWPGSNGDPWFLHPALQVQLTDADGGFEFRGLHAHPYRLLVGMALFDVNDPTTVPFRDGVFSIDLPAVDGGVELGAIVRPRR